MNPTKIKPFKIAYEKKLERDNYNAWLQGLYIQSSIKSALFGGKAKYPEQPLGTNVEVQETSSVDAEIQAKKFEAWTKIFNRKFDKIDAESPLT